MSRRTSRTRRWLKTLSLVGGAIIGVYVIALGLIVVDAQMADNAMEDCMREHPEASSFSVERRWWTPGYTCSVERSSAPVRAESVTYTDPERDASPGFDVRSVTLIRRDRALIVRVLVRGPIRQDFDFKFAPFSRTSICGYLEAKRRTKSIRLVNTCTGRSTPATGWFRGRTVVLSAPLANLGLTKEPFEWQALVRRSGIFGVDSVPDASNNSAHHLVPMRVHFPSGDVR